MPDQFAPPGPGRHRVIKGAAGHRRNSAAQREERVVKEQAINADGTRRDIAPANGTDYSLRELQEIVGGDIELVRLDDECLWVVNAEVLLFE